MMLRSSLYAERIMRGCATVLLRATGEEAQSLRAKVRKGVPVEKFTMGELIRLLKRLVPALKGKGLSEDVADEETWSILDLVLEMRNAFMHPTEVRQDPSLWIAYLEAVKRLCRTRLVQAAIKINNVRELNE